MAIRNGRQSVRCLRREALGFHVEWLSWIRRVSYVLARRFSSNKIRYLVSLVFVASITGCGAMTSSLLGQSDSVVNAGSVTQVDSDRSTALEIKARLRDNGFHEPYVYATVHHGTVTLSGDVYDTSELQLVEQLVRSVHGVSVVRNNLQLFHAGNGYHFGTRQ